MTNIVGTDHLVPTDVDVIEHRGVM